MRKRIALGVLVLAVLAGIAVAEEVTGTILFEPVQTARDAFVYSLATGENSRIADKKMSLNSGNVGSAYSDLSNYLVKGSKVVYENGGYRDLLEPMRNTMGESFGAQRMIAIIMEDSYYMELTEIVSETIIARYFPFLVQKLRREGRW